MEAEEDDAVAHALLDNLTPWCMIGRGPGSVASPCPAEAVYIVEYECDHGNTNRLAVCTGHRNAIHNFCEYRRPSPGTRYRVTFEELLVANPAT